MNFKLCLPLLLLTLAACDDGPNEQTSEDNSVTQEQMQVQAFSGRVDIQFEALEKPETESLKKPMQYCDGQPLIVDMGEYKFEVNNRGSAMVKLLDGSQKSDFRHQCNIKIVTNASYIRFPFFGIAKGEAITNYAKKQYQRHLDQIENLNSTTLENGTNKFQVGNVQIFVLPSQENRTSDNSPVTIKCLFKKNQKSCIASTCTSWSQIREDLYMQYSFDKCQYTEDQFIEIDQNMQNRFNDMLISE